MSDEVIVALITGGVSLLGNLLASLSLRKKDAITRAIHEQQLVDKLDRLEKKVDEHNSYGKKFGDVATAMVAMQKDIEYLRKATKL